MSDGSYEGLRLLNWVRKILRSENVEDQLRTTVTMHTRHCTEVPAGVATGDANLARAQLTKHHVYRVYLPKGGVFLNQLPRVSTFSICTETR